MKTFNESAMIDTRIFPLIILCLISCQTNPQLSDYPNIVYILADDLGIGR